ncbi:histidine phosphatase family protein [Deinococcus fonticola]|uniref:histidine phosphatase family protein n=1 Tax=Deinococcus fonticola TaxID=2528713 RepID=UPI001074E3B5|nr:histidine phosphatase family protein [Deinococcus fonticola]
MTRTLHLIKHGKPFVIPGVPAHEWELASDALQGLPGLVERLQPRPDIVISSEEPKAKATAQGLAGALGVRHRPMLGLHEQLRYTAPFHADVQDFQADIQRLFAYPDDLVSGEESAADARRRFGHAVNAAMQANPQQTVAIVAHGTVISLLASHAAGVDALELWLALTFLDVVTLSWPELKLQASRS